MMSILSENIFKMTLNFNSIPSLTCGEHFNWSRDLTLVIVGSVRVLLCIKKTNKGGVGSFCSNFFVSLYLYLQSVCAGHDEMFYQVVTGWI